MSSRIPESLLTFVARRYRRRGLRKVNVSVASVQAAALATIRRSRYCTVVTGDGEHVDVRVLQPRRPKAGLIINLGTSGASRKVEQIRRSAAVVLVYTDFRRGCGVVVHAEAEVLDDPAISRAVFIPIWRAFWPDGPDDPDFVVIRCRPTAIEVWDFSRGITPAPFGLAGARIERHSESWRLVT